MPWAAALYRRIHASKLVWKKKVKSVMKQSDRDLMSDAGWLALQKRILDDTITLCDDAEMQREFLMRISER